MAIPLMVVSFILFGGLLWWLYQTAEPTQPPVVDESGETSSLEGGTEVDPGALAVGPGQFEGQLVRLSNVTVASAVGAQAFFVDLPQTPFLIRMDTALVARGMTVVAGEQVDLVGMLMSMTDSIVSDWFVSGAITDADRPLVEFASHFIEAQQVQTSGG